MLTCSQLAHVMRLPWGRGRDGPPTTPSASPLPHMYLAQAATLATGFQRFLARFSGRRRWRFPYYHKNPPPWAILVVMLASSLINIVDACSSRTTPKPRPPPPPTPRPNITFHTYECPPAYAAWYCLNGATCFTVKIGDSLLYNCECAEGFMGPRCEYKDLDGSYLPAQRGVMLERASIAGGVTVAVFLVVILCVVVYLHYAKRRDKASRGGCSRDCVDGPAPPPRQPTFGARWRQPPPTSAPPPVHDHGDSKQPAAKVELLQHVATLVPPVAHRFDRQEP